MKKTKSSLLAKVLFYLFIIAIISLILMLFIHQYSIINEVAITTIFNMLDPDSVVGGIYTAINSVLGFGSSAISGYIIGWLTILYVLTIATSLLILVVWALYKISNVFASVLGLRRF